MPLTEFQSETLRLLAERRLEQLPADEVGCLYLDGQNRPVTPDPDAPEFSKLRRHFGCVRGAWPIIGK